MARNPKAREQEGALERERSRLLARLEAWLELPMVVLGFVWLLLLVTEFVWGAGRFVDTAITVIWVVFIFDFGLKLVLAPHKGRYLKRNWLTVIALFIPALRVFRIARLWRVLRLAQATRGVRLVRVVASLNRGMRALSATMGRRGFGYVVLLTVLVTLAGAAGMFAFEQGVSEDGINSYGSAIWWTAMVMLTLGSDYWPQTLEGRILCVFLALYAVGIFGYVTATLASFFIGQDAEGEDTELVGARELRALQVEIAALRAELRGRGE